MTTPTGGLQGLTGFQDPATANEADAEQRNGGTADPRHGVYGEQVPPYMWEVMPGQPHGPYGQDAQLIGFDPRTAINPAGVLTDDPVAELQPMTRAAPWPKGISLSAQPDDATIDLLQQRTDIRSGDGFGLSRTALYMPTMEPRQDDWNLIDSTDAGSSLQDPNVNGQLKSAGSMGAGSTDRVSSFARQNGYGFDSAHMRRRYASVGTGALPGNYMYLQPGSRPFYKNPAGTGRPATGQDSPFTGQDITRDLAPYGAVLMNPPVAYSPPADPVQVDGYSGREAPVSVSFY